LFTPLPTATRLMTVTSTVSSARPVTAADLDRFARLDSLGLTVTGQQIFPTTRSSSARSRSATTGVLVAAGRVGVLTRCCGGFTHLPMGHRPTWLQVAAPRYECQRCGKVWRHRLPAVARPRSRLTRAAGTWALAAVVLDHVPVSSVARILGIAWHTAHSAVAELGRELLIGHPARLDGVQVIGVDEHCWRHTGFASDRFVTVIVDLTPVRDRTGPARLIDMVEGRSARAFQAWLDAQPDTFRHTVQVVAMDGFTGFKTAAAEAIPDATTRGATVAGSVRGGRFRGSDSRRTCRGPGMRSVGPRRGWSGDYRRRQQRRHRSRLNGLIELHRRIARGFRNPRQLPTTHAPDRRRTHPPPPQIGRAINGGVCGSHRTVTQ